MQFKRHSGELVPQLQPGNALLQCEPVAFVYREPKQDEGWLGRVSYIWRPRRIEVQKVHSVPEKKWRPERGNPDDPFRISQAEK
jgi:hypothetical protein